MREILPFIFAVLAGAFTAIEASINSHLGKIVTPKIATLHSLVTGVIIVLIGTLIKGSLHQYSKIIYVSPRWLIGGIFGALIIYLVTRTIPKLGVANTMTIVVASEVTCGLIIDAFLSKEQTLDWGKIFGVALLFIGIRFIVR